MSACLNALRGLIGSVQEKKNTTNSGSMGNAAPQDRKRAENETGLINFLKKLNVLLICKKYCVTFIKVDCEDWESDLT